MLLHYTDYFIERLKENSDIISDNNNFDELLSYLSEGYLPPVKNKTDEIIEIYIPKLNGKVIAVNYNKKFFAVTFSNNILRRVLTRSCELKWTKSKKLINEKLKNLDELILSDNL